MNRGARVDVVPWDYELNPKNFDGLFLSNGPGKKKIFAINLHHIFKLFEICHVNR